MAEKVLEYVVVELDKDIGSKHRVVSGVMTKEDAIADALYLNDHADPLASFKYDVEKITLAEL